MDKIELKDQIIRAITGNKGMHLSGSWENDIETLINEVESLSTFNPISRQSKCRVDKSVDEIHLGEMILRSKSLCEFLEGADQCVIMSATLGPRIDSRMGILQLTNMSMAYLFDLVCLHYLEMKLDAWESNFRKVVEGESKFLTQRFSPGYGDLPLETQGEVLDYLDAQKRIGIELTGNFLMIPQKSVTAILGISEDPFKRSYSRCDACLRRENCKTRGGKHCEFHK